MGPHGTHRKFPLCFEFAAGAVMGESQAAAAVRLLSAL